MTIDEIKIVEMTVCSYKEFGSSGAALEAIKKLRTLQPPESIENQLIDINENEAKKSTILFSNVIPRSPSDLDDQNVSILMDITEDNRLHIHMETDGRLIEEYQNTYNKIYDKIGNFYVDQFMVEFESSSELSEFDLPIIWDSNHVINGIQIQKDSENYIFESLKENLRENIPFDYSVDNGTGIHHRSLQKMDVDNDNAGTMVVSKIDKLHEFIESLRE